MAKPTQYHTLTNPHMDGHRWSSLLTVHFAELAEIAGVFAGVEDVVYLNNYSIIYFSPLYDHEEVWCELDDALKQSAAEIVKEKELG